MTNHLHEPSSKSNPPRPRVHDLTTRFGEHHEALRGMSFQEGDQRLRPRASDPVVDELRGSGLVNDRIAMFGGRGQGQRPKGGTASEAAPQQPEEPIQAPQQQAEPEPAPDAPPEQEVPEVQPEGPTEERPTAQAEGPVEERPAPNQQVEAHNERSDERREETVDELLEQRKADRYAELETMRGGQQPEAYKGRGTGGQLRHIAEDERLDYQVDRDSDTKGLFKRHGGNLRHKLGDRASELKSNVRETVTTKQGFKRHAKGGAKKVFDKGVNFIPLVGAVRDTATTKKESKRVKKLGRIRDDESVPVVGQKLAGGLGHMHKGERAKRAVGAVGGVAGVLGAGGAGIAKGALKLAVSGVDEAVLKKDRKTRLQSRLPVRGDEQSDSEHRGQVDEANENLVGLLKEDPNFSKALVPHLAERGAMGHQEELDQAHEAQGDDEEHTLKPSKVREFGLKEGARLGLREELGAGPSWTPDSEVDSAKIEKKRSKQEHKELDRRLDEQGTKSIRSDLQRALKEDLREVRSGFDGRREELKVKAGLDKQALQQRATEDLEKIETDLALAIGTIDKEEEQEKFFARILLKQEHVADRRGALKRNVTRNPRKRLEQARMAEIEKTYQAKREAAQADAKGRKKGVKARLKQALRQQSIEQRKAKLALEQEQARKLAERRNAHATNKRRALGEQVPELPAPAPNLRQPKRNLLAELRDVEKTKAWEKH